MTRLSEKDDLDREDWKRAALQARDDIRTIEKLLREKWDEWGDRFAQWSTPAVTMRMIDSMEEAERPDSQPVMCHSCGEVSGIEHVGDPCPECPYGRMISLARTTYRTEVTHMDGAE